MVLDENSGWRLFLSWMQEYFIYEFPEFSVNYKNKTIEKILLNNQKFVTKEEVIKENLCISCGQCCIQQQCNYYNEETHLCSIHNSEDYPDLCKEYPWGSDELGFQSLTINCAYQKIFWINWFTEYFQAALKLKEPQKEV